MASITFTTVKSSGRLIAPGDTVTVQAGIMANGDSVTGVSGCLAVECGGEWLPCTDTVTVRKTTASGGTKTYSFSFAAPAAASDNAFGYFQTNSVRGGHVRLCLTTIWFGGSTYGASLPGRNTSTQVSAIDQHIQPSISLFDAYRVSVSGGTPTADDEGTTIAFDLTLATALEAGDGDLDGLTCKLTVRPSGDYLDFTTSADPTGEINGASTTITGGLRLSDLLTGVTMEAGSFDALTISTGSDYELVVTFGDEYESATAIVTIPEAFANVHLADCGKGVAFGKFSASTLALPLFECEYKAYFAEDVAMPLDAFLTVVTTTVSVALASGDRAGSGVQRVTTALGYEPIAIVGIHTGNANFYPYAYYLDSNGVHVGVARYTGTVSSATTLSVTAYVLCQRVAFAGGNT